MLIWSQLNQYLWRKYTLDRETIKELGFSSRSEAMSFLKKLWNQEKTICPICGSELE